MKPYPLVSALIVIVLAGLLLAACTQLPTPRSEPLPELEPQANNWAVLGGILDIKKPDSTDLGMLALDNFGRAVVSWSESGSIYVKRWNGSAWIRVGPVIDQRYSAELALNSSGNPFLAVLQQDTSIGDTDLYVQSLVSNVWLPLPAADRNLSKNVSEASVALRSNNSIGVAWQEDDGSSKNIHASFWNGDNWVRYGGALDVTLGNQSASPSLAFQSNNFPVVAWQERVGANNNIFVKQWNGSAWINYGTGVALDRNVNNNAFAPSLALDSTNNPYVAWHETVNGNNNIFVKRWDSVGSSWVNVGNALDVTVINQSTNPSMAIDSMNRPVVAWQECKQINLLGECTSSDINVKRWNGSSWDWLSDLNRPVSLSINPSLSIDSMDIPIVAWQENDTIRVKRLSSNPPVSDWEELGTTLDRFGNIQASHPSIDVGPNGNPVVAWSEVMFESTTNSFYSYLSVKRWNGTVWVNIESTAASLNRSKVKNASLPSLAVGSNNSISVGFQESDGVSTNLYVTRF